MIWIVFLLVIGLLMVCLEVFIPGGIVGTLGAVALLGSIVLAFATRGASFGLYWMGGTAVAALLGIYLSIRSLPASPAGKRLLLGSSEAGFSAAEEGLAALAGKRGTAITNLRPAGLAEIGDDRIDVVTGGEYLKKGTAVEVVRVDGNRVVVRAEEPAVAAAADKNEAIA